MRTPISYALGWPNRLQWNNNLLDLVAIGQLTFSKVDTTRFPCFELARQALLTGGAAPTVLNASNEIAVAAFLQRKIGFMQIPVIVETVLNQLVDINIDDLDAIMAIDTEARRLASGAVTDNQGS